MLGTVDLLANDRVDVNMSPDFCANLREAIAVTMTFVPGWERPKLAAIPSDAELLQQRAGLSGARQKALKIHPKDIEYQRKNNALREADGIFLDFFDEPSVRSAVQQAQPLFKHEPAINTLLEDMIGSSKEIRIDQGTHQAEDRHAGGFKLHFDARRPDNLCFHFYVGQNANGSLKIIEISYMNGGNKVEATPTA